MDGKEVDFLWVRERVIVETDGYEHHGTRAAFEGDRLHDERLAVEGYVVVRVSARRLARDPRALAQSLRALPARRASA